MLLAADRGRAIRALRRSLGLRQCDFAERLGFCVQTIGRWEAGLVCPRKRSFAAMAQLGPIVVPPEAPDREPALERQPFPPGSFGEYAEEWLAIHLPRLRPSSRLTYASQLRRHVLPVLGSKPLAAITRADVRALLRGCLAKGLAHGSVRFIGTVTRAIISTAYDDELIPTDPSHRATRRLVFRVARRARRPFTSAEAARFLAAVEHRAPRRVDYLAFRLLARTGLRIGELCAVRFDKIDLRARLLHIAETYHGAGRFGPTKSGKPRTIPITPDAEAVIRELLRGREHEPPDAFLLASRKNPGQPVSPNWLQRLFRRTAKAIGFDYSLSPHSFRHAAATHLCEAGVNVMVVRDLLGHADLQTTMMYAKRATVQDAAAIARLDGFAPRAAGVCH